MGYFWPSYDRFLINTPKMHHGFLIDRLIVGRVSVVF